MPEFEIDGYGRDTGRKRHRRYVARDREDAIMKASADGTVVGDVTPVKFAHLLTDIAGVSHKNADNTSRQRYLNKCEVFDRVILEHEEGNRHDRNAVKVMRETGEQIGYLPSTVAGSWMKCWRSTEDTQYSALIMSLGDITDGYGPKRILGGDILIVTARDIADEESISEYAEQLKAKYGIPKYVNLVPDERLHSRRKLPQAELFALRPRKRRRKAAKRDNLILWAIIITGIWLMLRSC